MKYNLEEVKSMMNQNELLLFVSTLLFLINSLYKWKKTLVLLVFFEMVASLLLFLMVTSGILYFLILILFLFFVSEALVLISSFYSSIRVGGSVFSVFLLFCSDNCLQ